jgi:hypothetical protein
MAATEGNGDRGDDPVFAAGYGRGYQDGLSDAAFELAGPLVARAARLVDCPNDLCRALGRAVATGESRQTAPLTPTNRKGD